MVDKITIAGFDINVDKVISKIEELKIEISTLKSEQSKLSTQSSENSAQYEAYNVAIIAANKSLDSQRKIASQLINENKSLENSTKSIANELNKENREILDVNKLLQSHKFSIKEVEDQNRKLSQARKELDLSTEKGLNLQARIDEKLQSNTNFLKENTFSYKERAKNISKNNDIIETEAEKLQRLNDLLKQEAASINQSKDQNKALVKLRGDLNLKTKDGAEQQSIINRRIDENNKFIYANSSGFEKLKFKIGDYTNGVISAIQQTTGLGGGLNFLTGAVSGTAAIFTGLAAAIGFTAKKSADYEEALLSVRQASGITAEESDRLLDSLKLINTRTNIEGLIELSSIGAQIGETSAKGLSDFANAADKVSVGLGKRLGPNVEEVLTQLAKLSVITGDSSRIGLSNGIERIGSSIAVLADIGTATGPKIAEFAERIGGIASQLNLVTPVVLGFGAAVEELGQEPAVAATQIQDLFLKIGGNVSKYSKIAGIEVEKFSEILKTKPEQAFISVLRGLKSYGGGVEEISKKLTDAGIQEDRSIRVLGALANNIDLVTDRINNSKKAYEENIKIQQNFNAANETTTAQFKKLYNNVVQTFSNSALNEVIKSAIGGINSLLVKGEQLAKQRSEDEKLRQRASDNLRKINNKPFQSRSDVDAEVERIKLLDIKIKKDKEASDKAEENSKRDKLLSNAKIEQNERQRKINDDERREDIKIELDKLQAQKNVNDLSFKEQKEYYTKLYNLKVESINLDDKLNNKQKNAQKDIAKIDLKQNIGGVDKNIEKQELSDKKKAADESIKIAKNELDAFLLTNKSRLDNNKYINDEIYNNELKRIENSRQAEVIFQQKRIISGIASAEEAGSAIIEINAKYENQKIDLQNKRDEDDKARKAANLQLDGEIQQLSYDNEYEKQLAQLDRQYQAEIAAADKNGADLLKIETKYALARKKINDNLENAKLDATKQVFGDIVKIFGEQTVLGKAAAIATATINTYQGATEVLKAPTVIPEPFGTPAKFVSAAAIIANGLATVDKIVSVETPKAARGANINGPSHANGGVDIAVNGTTVINAEGGEKIINKRSSAMFPELLSAINVAGGGIPLAANGGSITSFSSINRNSITKASENSIDIMKRLVDNVNQTKVVTIVDDISTGLYNRTVVLDRARI